MGCVEMISHQLKIFDTSSDPYFEKSRSCREIASSCERCCCTAVRSSTGPSFSPSRLSRSLPCTNALLRNGIRLPAHRNFGECQPLSSCSSVRSSSNHGQGGRKSLTGGKNRDHIVMYAGFGEFLKQASFVHWFREAWPYIQGHRSSVFVIVLPGDVIADGAKLDGVLQDVLLLHGLGVKIVVIPGTQPQIDELLIERGHEPEYEGAYRITGKEALAAAMEAAGRIRVTLEAKLSRGTSSPDLRRSAENDRWSEVAVASGNYLAAKRRGVVNGVDFGATGEVKRIDTKRIREDLDEHSIVLLSNLGYSSTGEVLNCNTYEVATACAIALQADKLLCLLDGPVLDENGRPFRFMTLREADKLIRERASQSIAAADYVKAVAGPAYVRSLGLSVSHGNGSTSNGAVNGARNGSYGSNGRVMNIASNGSCGSKGQSRNTNGHARHEIDGYAKSTSTMAPATVPQEKSGKGFAIGGLERFSRTNGYLSELTAAVYVCRNGVGRVHLLDSNIQGALLLELYSRDGIGNMVSSDSYEGAREATSADLQSVLELLKPFVEDGILVDRPWNVLKQEIENYIVVERDGSIIACCALFPYENEKCGELAAFAVSPECRGSGLGSSLLEYVEKRAAELRLERIFVLTTRTSDWFVQRGFTECTVDILPETRRQRIDFARRSKYYQKYIKQGATNGVLTYR
ncbi:amino-acid N-acetyltransferase [Marchantia polymorpha subsp. ruderalis]|uniref:amino-acid N-acetyltransferase n=2 Tax=Marchantia polymorpha TaxID=3197 RepID=A0AAF6BE56_MARPO|nr:hypothetical protein MARPO_0147s0030 [Marchantia polymorpha]BBN10290.1 hypothetical protein Mp_5g02370 [Marchantia polymorpha subsp. ruderalis]|eukprot:PTQ29151.1 hypothetical protein MARPO_0147s0030 [Marchantia polymorpha]